ncbi:hypothetical protein [Thermococcus barophilus]|uniref:Uncharacterized protein n=1 Tax=Thermococcus barophilus TaxID=55802 RepID=A0A0S1XCU9_THEBA|nr:hypothetical protein [Thermococcus barophilus]ALM75612.1 conserved exported hypothetical protein [Thermococcus barophilus]
MKGKLLLILLLIAGAYLYLNWDFQIPDDLSPERVIDTAKNVTNNLGETSTATEKPFFNGAETSGTNLAGNVTVLNSGNWTVIHFETSVIDGDLLGVLYTLAEKARENGSENIRVEAYFGEEPILALTIENGDFDNPVFEDIRRPEFRIETDLGLFDVLVHNVTVTNDTASVSLEYLAGEDSFWGDYARMSLAILEDAPWVERVEILYLGERNVSISVLSEDLLKALSGNLTPKEFADAVKIVELEKK